MPRKSPAIAPRMPSTSPRPPRARPATDAATTLASLKEVMRDFVAEREWQKYHTPRNLAASIAVEAGELLELFQWLTPKQATDRSHNDPRFRQALADELSDVFMYLISLANATHLDIAQSISDKMARNRKKYPPERFLGHYERPIESS